MLSVIVLTIFYSDLQILSKIFEKLELIANFVAIFG